MHGFYYVCGDYGGSLKRNAETVSGTFETEILQEYKE
jgi:hypothetical protein